MQTRSYCTPLRLFVLLMTVFLLFGQSGIYAQDLRTSLFEEADKSMSLAKENAAKLLAPTLWERGQEAYAKAEKEFNNGKNLDKIREKLREAVQFFQDAVKAAEIAKNQLSTALKARLDAQKAGAADYAAEDWKKAGSSFREAAEKLESGDSEAANKKAGEAERYYRQAELVGVKANFLDETRTLLQEAEETKVEKSAPQTLARAKELLQTAEVEIEKNRYDTDYPRSLAKQAKYEVKHALYLARTIEEFEKKKMRFEDVMLLNEKPLEEIAGTIGLVAEFDEGFGKTTQSIKVHIQSVEEANANYQQELTDAKRQIEMLNAQVAELNEQLGGIAKEKSELAMKIEEQRILKEKYEKIGKIFTKEEAQVLRTPENNLIIRLIGLNFKSGKSDIDAEYFALLGKVKEAFNIFPDCHVGIEGHTDSFGGDQMNLELSQKRADAVRNYILANMNWAPDMITAHGFGETKPIGNNETKEGRAKNRRIDILLMQ